MTDKSIFTATRIRGEEKEFLGSVLLSSETDTASEFFRNIIKKDDKDVEVQKTETGYVLTDKADRDTCYILTRTQLDDAFWNSCTADKKHCRFSRPPFGGRDFFVVAGKVCSTNNKDFDFLPNYIFGVDLACERRRIKIVR